MSLAEEMLNNLAVEDAEPHIIIGTNRVITVPDVLKKIAVQYDHNIETVTFDCPRYWDDRDLSTMIGYINYRLPNGELGCYSAENLTVDSDNENIIHFDWTITKNVTPYKGNITFLVCFKDVDNYGNEKVHWNTDLNKDMYISEGLECAEVLLEDDPDLVTQLLRRMDALEKGTINIPPANYGSRDVIVSELPQTWSVNNTGDITGNVLSLPGGWVDIAYTGSADILFTIKDGQMGYNVNIRIDDTDVCNEVSVTGKTYSYKGNISRGIKITGILVEVEFTSFVEIISNDGLMTGEDKAKLDKLKETKASAEIEQISLKKLQEEGKLTYIDLGVNSGMGGVIVNDYNIDAYAATVSIAHTGYAEFDITFNMFGSEPNLSIDENEISLTSNTYHFVGYINEGISFYLSLGNATLYWHTLTFEDGYMSGEDKWKLDNLSQSIGDIDTALDELHEYAQSVISGGVSE